MSDKPITVLGIESSCDETGASVCQDGTILSNVIATQEVHRQYGGVVPELASRAHMQHIVPVVQKALEKAGINARQLNAVAFTSAPGLIGALLVGSGFAKSFALSLNIPIISVHHMKAHVLANMIPEQKPDFPFLCLTVSGGHTQIVMCSAPNQMEVIGETIDDAAGEAFDKSAKLLGLPYPGGPLIDKLAKTGKPEFIFAEPQIPNLDFSFSGVKTSILYFLQAQEKKDADFIKKNLPDLAASIQERIITILLKKVKKAVAQTGVKQVCLAGGVAANSGLRNAFKSLGEESGWKTFIPPLEYCTDNAAMIAMTGYYQYLDEQFSDLSVSPSAKASW
ncbi:tRNA (adenosine(37)-N6)-threonylcarbamoyltransferase complex transferase subunit TsaD [Pollutibacter soli]|uniref:tRNA (adenosine(37)-N6)-threonylcarbamoyltransferase complex transferase subunit TsaD n=1 Tax=Pollutibacter soli TaxID=3034157 RepID=UPI003013F24F